METGRARIPEEQMTDTPFQALPPEETLAQEPPPMQQAPIQQAPIQDLLSQPVPPPPVQPYAQPASAPEPSSSGAGNVEQIRDILFGAQMRDYERRFSNLEARLTHEAAMLRDDIRARFDALELAMRQQFNALSESLGTERDNRTGAVHKVSEDVRVLRNDAADRRALAAMFIEMARRLETGSGETGDGRHGNTPPPDAQ